MHTQTTMDGILVAYRRKDVVVAHIWYYGYWTIRNPFGNAMVQEVRRVVQTLGARLDRRINANREDVVQHCTRRGEDDVHTANPSRLKSGKIDSKPLLV